MEQSTNAILNPSARSENTFFVNCPVAPLSLYNENDMFQITSDFIKPNFLCRMQFLFEAQIFHYLLIPTSKKKQFPWLPS